MQLQPYEINHIECLRKYLPECTVLLKSNGDFPLASTCKIALYGSGVRHTIKGGTGSGEVNSRYYVSIEDAFIEAGFTVTTTDWLDAYDKVKADAKVAFYKGIKQEARKAHQIAIMYAMGAVVPEPEYSLPLNGEGDVCLYVLSRISGEGNDRKFQKGDILLSDTEVRDIKTLAAMYPKFLLVINAGGPVDLSPVMNVENILVLSQLGVETGSCLVDLVLGKAYPSGKLATTWAASEVYPAIGEFGDRDETRYKEGIYVGYRYFDSAKKEPLFPFGFGLSYTTFALERGLVEADGSLVKVTGTVTNTGKCPGKEVVQLYVSAPSGELDQPYQALAAFAKTGEIAPGEKETVTLCFDFKDLASYSEARASWILEAGDFVLRLGTSSRDTCIVGSVSLSETVVVKEVKNVLGKPDFIDWKPAEAKAVEIPKGLPCIAMDPAVLTEGTITYDIPYPVVPEVHEMTDEELCYMNTGAFDPKGGLLSVIGNASSSVAGAAGETTSFVKTTKVPVIVMADGPAGLRLSRDFVKDAKGVHSLGATLPESIADLMPKVITKLTALTSYKPAKNAVVSHQYATAIPIGTAICQSWNTDLAKDLGDIVGDEMERFGVHLWLAPALNIHRSIRCGRNFEYFSEDPLLSGLFASAITDGVQKHPGCGTTIKHYAANNQETNRYGSNSQVSERAMREIYLKGFEICVKKSQPHALMTSYNLLNGTHTSEHRGLVEDILRNEFGFQGIVMTDWVIGALSSAGSKYGRPDAYKVAKAGGDLMMPGSKGDFENILKARKEGKISRTQLEENATRVYLMGKKLVEKA